MSGAEWLAELGALGALLGLIWLCFNATEHVLRREKLDAVSQWLTRKGGGQTPSWPQGVIEVFDRLLVPRIRLEWATHHVRTPMPGFLTGIIHGAADGRIYITGLSNTLIAVAGE